MPELCELMSPTVLLTGNEESALWGPKDHMTSCCCLVQGKSTENGADRSGWSDAEHYGLDSAYGVGSQFVQVRLRLIQKTPNPITE